MYLSYIFLKDFDLFFMIFLYRLVRLGLFACWIGVNGCGLYQRPFNNRRGVINMFANNELISGRHPGF